VRTAPDGPERVLVWLLYAAERTAEDSVQRNSNTNGYLRGFVISLLFY